MKQIILQQKMNIIFQDFGSKGLSLEGGSPLFILAANLSEVICGGWFPLGGAKILLVYRPIAQQCIKIIRYSDNWVLL